LEEGIVKTGSFSIDQGVGVRAVSGEKTAFAYSDDISLASLMDAAHTVRSIAAAGRQVRTKVPAKRVAHSRSLYGGQDPIGSLDSAAKVALLEHTEQLARARDPLLLLGGQLPAATVTAATEDARTRIDSAIAAARAAPFPTAAA
jgi:TldD protein